MINSRFCINTNYATSVVLLLHLTKDISLMLDILVVMKNNKLNSVLLYR